MTSPPIVTNTTVDSLHMILFDGENVDGQHVRPPVLAQLLKGMGC